MWSARRLSSINKGLVQRLQSNAAGTLGEHLAGDIDLTMAFGPADTLEFSRCHGLGQRIQSNHAATMPSSFLTEHTASQKYGTTLDVVALNPEARMWFQPSGNPLGPSDNPIRQAAFNLMVIRSDETDQRQ